MAPKKMGPIAPQGHAKRRRDREALHAAHTAGTVPQKNKTNWSQIIVSGNRRIKLQDADGALTQAGLDYYDIAGIEPPTLYTYEQELENGRWVTAYDGTKVLVRRWDSGTQAWKVTKTGEAYFKYRRVQFVVHVPALQVRLRDNVAFAEEYLPVDENSNEHLT